MRFTRASIERQLRFVENKPTVGKESILQIPAAKQKALLLDLLELMDERDQLRAMQKGLE